MRYLKKYTNIIEAHHVLANTHDNYLVYTIVSGNIFSI